MPHTSSNIPMHTSICSASALDSQVNIRTRKLCLAQVRTKNSGIMWGTDPHSTQTEAKLACTFRAPASYVITYMYMGVSQNLGYHFGAPYNKDYSILGSILGYPYLGKLPYIIFIHTLTAWAFEEKFCRSGCLRLTIVRAQDVSLQNVVIYIWGLS